MAKNIWVYSRKKVLKSVENQIYRICEKISPDNITPRQPKVVVNDHVAFGIMNPTTTLLVKNNSLLMGKTFGDNRNWDVPNEDFPDGSYALFRDSSEYCEIVTDPVASRTIWYYLNDEIFVASTSQRAITLFIGDFQFNKKVIPWVLSTGTLGPDYSWDKRISKVSPDSSVTLNKGNWTLSVKTNPIKFDEVKNSDKIHRENLKSAIDSTFKSIKLNYNDWILPLSGGYDSRGILCLLRSNNCKNLRTITWGLESSINESGNDASVAHELSKTLNIPHDYYHTNLSKEPAEELFNRFLLNGEGRIDHIAGYMDGFEIWKSLFDKGIQGIIRGDEALGSKKISSPLTVRLLQGLGLCTDYFNLNAFTDKGYFEQEIPKYLSLENNESLDKWRDRLYQEYRIPTAMSALADLKLSYVEIVNPLLSKCILQETRKIPDHLRTDKVLFKKIVDSISPKIPYAKEAATASPGAILQQKEIVALLTKELSSKIASELFLEDFLSHVLEKINKSNKENTNKNTASSSLKAFISKNTPGNIKTSIRNILRNRVPTYNSINYNTLAFRMFIIIKMNRILIEKI